MSTLTSTPSPTASPRNPFHAPQRHRPYSQSPHLSPRSSPRPLSASPKRPFHALVPPSHLLKDPAGNIDRPVVGVQQQHGSYVDRGTQYSPDGFPPTTGRKVAVAKAAQSAGEPARAPSSAKKRKESTRSESPPRQQMSVEQSSPSASSARHGPKEPQLRVQPSEASAAAGDSRTAQLPQRTAGQQQQQQAEPEEARSTHDYSSEPKRSRPEPGTVKIMPTKYETCNPKDLGVLISNMLMELIRLNDRIPLRDGRLTRFHSRAPPGISVADYLQRLIQHATLSPPILLSMVYYIDRLCALYPAFTINSLTVHRFLITAATVAAKGLSDSFWTNPTYARIGGIPVTELATLELEFLQKVNWKIVPKPEVLEEYYRSLVERTAGFELESSVGSDSSSWDESEEGGDGRGDRETGSGDDKMVDAPR